MKYLFFILSLVFSQVSLASTINNAKITAVLTGEVYGSAVYLKISHPPSNLPACQTNPNYNYVFDPSTAVGQVTLSMVLTAYAANKEVYLDGYGTCSAPFRTDVEKLRQIRIQ